MDPRNLTLHLAVPDTAHSFSRFLIEEAPRILKHFGAEVNIFDPTELPMAASPYGW